MSGFDPVRVIETLAEHGVEFVIIGGFAAELHGAPIPATQDVDVTPSGSSENLARLSSALDDLGARIRVNAEPEGFAFSHDAGSLGRARMWNLTCPASSFDVTFLPSGTAGYDDLVRSASVLRVHGHPVAVAALADVIRSKEAAGRPKDLATLPALKRWLRAVEGIEPAERTRALAAALEKRRRPNGGADRDATGL